MKHLHPVFRALIAAAVLAPALAAAQNVAIVNGKAVPKSRMDFLIRQATLNGQPVTPALEQQARDQVVLREIFVQEAERRGHGASADFRMKMELARQSILIGELFEAHVRDNPVTDETAKAEYDRLKAQEGGTEYHARHILVEDEGEAKKLIAQVKAGAKFDDLAKKHSKDPGSGANGGDLGYAKAESYVGEFAQALTKLGKGELTQEPVKTQFGWHVIKLEDSREAQFPAFDDVREQVKRTLGQKRLQDYQENLRKSARTDYKFGAQP